MRIENGERPYPEVAAFAAHVASLKRLPTVLDFGLTWTPEMSVLHPDLEIVGVGVWQAATRRHQPSHQFSDRVEANDKTRLDSISRRDLTRSLVVLTGPSESIGGPGMEPPVLDTALRTAPVTIVATTEPAPALARLAAAGLQPAFTGRTRASGLDDERSATLFVVDRSVQDHGAPPDQFRVVAIMTAFNEEDIIGPSIARLVGDGVGVYVIDNWSTDGTYAIAEGFRGAGLVGLERFPSAPTELYEWRSLLGRVEAVATRLDADWVIHHDADERRCGPWPGMGLREALWNVDQAGFSAVDHTVLNFRPIDNGFTPGGDFEAYFRHFEFGRTSDLLLQVKAWKNIGPVDLASTGGHEARFADRRVFPYKFELKHYPIRSQSHGETKVFRDRVTRWDPKERAAGWHVHYDDVRPEQSFLRSAADLIEDRGPATRAQYMAEFLTGAGLSEYSIPSWALGSTTGRDFYLSVRRFSHTRTGKRLRWWLPLPLRAGRKMLRKLRPGGLAR
jgi:hypothetical protein